MANYPPFTPYGYYAQGVSESTAFLPAGWKERLVIIQSENTRNARGLCLEVHDLLASKAIAGGEKDIDFLTEAARHHLARPDKVLARLDQINADPAILDRARSLVNQIFK